MKIPPTVRGWQASGQDPKLLLSYFKLQLNDTSPLIVHNEISDQSTEVLKASSLHLLQTYGTRLEAASSEYGLQVIVQERHGGAHDSVYLYNCYQLGPNSQQGSQHIQRSE